jgi:hypothetical protein
MTLFRIVQPTDDNGQPVPVVGFVGTTVSVLVPDGSASAATALPTGTIPGDIIRVAGTGPLFIEFGGGSVAATVDSPILMSPEYFKVAAGQTHFSVYGMEAGRVSVSRMG